MTKVKICGIRSPENALIVARAGADLIGLNFYPESPRYVEPALARAIAGELRVRMGENCPTLVGVFVNATADDVRSTAAYVSLDYAQLSGDESLSAVRDLNGIAFKAIRPADEAEAMASVNLFADTSPKEEDAPSLLLDAFNPRLYGGTGETASEAIALAVKSAVPRLMLAGGLTPENVAERVRRIKPWAVDVASGVEDGTPGIKDEYKVRNFIEALRTGQT